QDDRFWFLEMNTRLQVEHPVTEEILGLDLVRMQLAVAEGRPLPVEARHCTPSGHAVEARLYAEDPAAGYRPQSGVLRRFEIDPAPGLRVETGVASGSVVGSEYDPMLAKIVVHAGSRSEAVRRLAAALEGMRIHGLRTNRDQLVAALRHPEFAAGDVDTGFLDRHHAALTAPRGGAEAVRLHAAAAALAGLRVGAIAPDAVDLEVDGRRRRVAVARTGAVVDCDSVLGHTELVELDPFPLPEERAEAGSLVAPLAGVVVRVAAPAGVTVQAGDLLVAIESMKVEYR